MQYDMQIIYPVKYDQNTETKFAYLLKLTTINSKHNEQKLFDYNHFSSQLINIPEIIVILKKYKNDKLIQFGYIFKLYSGYKPQIYSIVDFFETKTIVIENIINILLQIICLFQLYNFKFSSKLEFLNQ